MSSPAHLLKAQGYTATQLKQAGYTATQLITVPALFYFRDSIGDRWQGGSVTITNLTNNQTVITSTGPTVKNALWDYRNINLIGPHSYSISRINGSYSEENFYAITTSDLMQFSGTKNEISAGSGVILSQQKMSSTTINNFTISSTLYYTASELRTAGYTATELKDAGYSDSQILNAGYISPTINNFSIDTKTFGQTPFNITDPSSNSDGSFNYTSSNPLVATIDGSNVTIVGAGESLITATQVATANYLQGSIDTSFVVLKADPNIRNFSIDTKIFGETPFYLVAPESNSDGSFNYTSSNPLVATIDGSNVTIVGAGESLITATQIATANYLQGSVDASFTVLKADPNIRNFSIDQKTYGDTSFNIVDPSSNSDGSFNYTSSNPSVAAIDGSNVTIVGTGETLITATQIATANYLQGSIDASFVVLKADPNLRNFSIDQKTYGDTSFNITDPSSNSDGSFNYTSSNTSVATIDGSVVTIIGVGSTLITATQFETENYLEGSIDASFVVNKAPATLINFSIDTKTFGVDPFNLTEPESNSDGAFTYESSNPLVATIDGSNVTIVGAGETLITATQVTTANYLQGSIDASFVVNKANPGLNNFSSITKTFGDQSFNLVAPDSNSDGSFIYTSSNLNVATIEGSTVTIIGAGSTEIKATQSTTTNYLDASINTILTVNKAQPIITNFSIPEKFNTDPLIFDIVDPSSNSDGSFNYVSLDESVATISGNTITIQGPGDSIITVTQSETANYLQGTSQAIFYSNVCFPAGTPINCDQGIIAIEKINPEIHTIRNKKIIGITQTIHCHDKYLVCFEKDSLGKNIPSQKTVMSRSHKVLYKGKMVRAYDLLDLDNVYKVKYNGEVLYNVLLEKYDKMVVNNLICETLDPEHDIAQLYKVCKTLSKEEQIKLAQWYNNEYKSRNKESKKFK